MKKKYYISLILIIGVQISNIFIACSYGQNSNSIDTNKLFFICRYALISEDFLDNSFLSEDSLINRIKYKNNFKVDCKILNSSGKGFSNFIFISANNPIEIPSKEHILAINLINNKVYRISGFNNNDFGQLYWDNFVLYLGNYDVKQKTKYLKNKQYYIDNYHIDNLDMEILYDQQIRDKKYYKIYIKLKKY